MIVGNYFVIVFGLIGAAFVFAGPGVAFIEREIAKGAALFVGGLMLGALASLIVDLGGTTWVP